MKYTLTLLITLFSFLGYSQQVKINPTGKIKSACPGVTVTGTSAIDALADTILANSLVPQSKYEFEVSLLVTTGASVGNITAKLKLGTDSVTIMSGNLALLQTNKLVKIRGKIVAQSNTVQWVESEILSDGSLISTLAASNVQVGASFAQNLANMQPVKVTVQMGGILVGSSCTVRYWETRAY